MKLNWNFLGGGAAKQKPSVGGMDIFWNYTFKKVVWYGTQNI